MQTTIKPNHQYIEGKYIESIAKSLEFSNNSAVGQAEQKVIENKTNSPILSIKNVRIEDGVLPLSGLDEVFIQSTLEKAEAELSKVESVAVPGFLPIQKEDKGDFTAQVGAYDNYAYLSSSSFTAQALSEAAHKYVKITGKISDGNNQRHYSEFQEYINMYEEYIIRNMELPKYNEALDWYDRIVAFVSLVAGFGTGPAGWVQICLNYAGALSLFRNLTSYAYATEQRKDYSKSAMNYLQQASLKTNYKNWTNTKMTLVDGY